MFLKHSALKPGSFSGRPTQTKRHCSLLFAQLPGLSFLCLVFTVFCNRMHRLLSSFLPLLIVYNMVQALPGLPPEEFRPLRIPQDRLFCSGPLPDFKYGNIYTSWSVRDTLGLLDCDLEEWSKLNFTDLTDLCAIHGNAAGNMGGMVKTYSWMLMSLDLLSTDYLQRSVYPHHLPI